MGSRNFFPDLAKQAFGTMTNDERKKRRIEGNDTIWEKERKNYGH